MKKIEIFFIALGGICGIILVFSPLGILIENFYFDWINENFLTILTSSLIGTVIFLLLLLKK
ncbi:MAG: hypothetical protein U9M94_01260 [Patescibacteria group bacterium]|nr:hypothetical protein [Patescibacteria group bacterium]